MNASDYAKQFKALLPPGDSFDRQEGSEVSKTALAVGDELARVDDRAQDLLLQYTPGTATEMLADWEEALSIDAAATTAARQLEATQKLTHRGGQSRAYFIARALALGYTVTITEFGPSVLRVGFRVGDRVYGTAYAYAWQVNVSAPAGDAVSHAVLEAVFEAAKPAHTVVIFDYL